MIQFLGFLESLLHRFREEAKKEALLGILDRRYGSYMDGRREAFEEAGKIAETEWKKHPFPQISPGENAELTALRIRDAIRQRAKRWP